MTWNLDFKDICVLNSSRFVLKRGFHNFTIAFQWIYQTFLTGFPRRETQFCWNVLVAAGCVGRAHVGTNSTLCFLPIAHCCGDNIPSHTSLHCCLYNCFQFLKIIHGFSIVVKLLTNSCKFHLYKFYRMLPHEDRFLGTRVCAEAEYRNGKEAELISIWHCIFLDWLDFPTRMICTCHKMSIREWIDFVWQVTWEWRRWRFAQGSAASAWRLWFRSLVLTLVHLLVRPGQA